MKCTNCGFENNNESYFCGSCGKPLYKDTTNIQPSEPVSKTKRSKKKIIIIGSIVACFLLVIIVIKLANKSNNFKDPFPEVDELTMSNVVIPEKGDREEKTFSNLIEEDYKNGFLSTDEYIMQLAYSVFDNDKLDESYKSVELDYCPNQLFNEVEKKTNELSDETILYLYKLFSLNNLQWADEDNVEETETGYTKIDNYNAIPLNDTDLTTNDTNLTKLNHVKLSSGGHFLIYYTTDGRNAVKESIVESIATHMEEVIDKYKSQYGLNYKYSIKYEPFSSGDTLFGCPIGTSKGNACRLLKKHNIDTKYLDTAMPVFIASTKSHNSSALAYYVPSFMPNYLTALARVYHKFGLDDCDYLNEEDKEKCLNEKTMTDHITTTYAYPFFVVTSDLDSIDDFKIASAHELFHHYQKYICGDGNYAGCSSGGFTEETTADYAPIKVAGINRRNSLLENHANYYIDNTDQSIDIVGGGYAAFPFAYNYAKMVNKGETALFNSLKYKDTLAYLKNQSGGEYKNVILTTAIKGLTKDYDNKLIYTSSYPPNHNSFGTEDVQKSENIAYSSAHYYYISPLKYGEKTQISFNSNTSDLTLVLFILENGVYRNVYTHSLGEEFVINPYEFGYYGQLVFLIVDSSVSGQDTYDYEVDTDGNKNLTVTPSSLGLRTMDELSKYNSFTCYQAEDNGYFRKIIQVKLSFDKKDKINDMYAKGTFLLNNYDPDNPAFQIAQKIGTGSLRLLENTYKEQFKYYKIMTYEGKDRYSVLFKIKKNYYEALNNALDVEGEDKVSIIKSIQSDGFVCSYSK